MLTKKIQSQPESRELFYLVGNVQDSEPGRQHLSSSEKIALKREVRESGYIQVCNKVGRQSEHQRLLLIKEARYQAMEFSVLL